MSLPDSLHRGPGDPQPDPTGRRAERKPLASPERDEVAPILAG